MLVLKRRVGEWLVLDDFLYVEVVGFDKRAGQVHVKVVEWYEDGSFSADVVYKLTMSNPQSFADIGKDFDLSDVVEIYAVNTGYTQFTLGISAPHELSVSRMDEFPEYREHQKSYQYVDEYGMFGRTTGGTKTEAFGWSSFGDVSEDDDVYEDFRDTDREKVSSQYGSDVSWFFE